LDEALRLELGRPIVPQHGLIGLMPSSEVLKLLAPSIVVAVIGLATVSADAEEETRVTRHLLLF
jgi:hypothetical protein